MKNSITPNQITAIYSLLAKAGLRDEKDNIVASFTNGRTDHVSEMLKEEAATLIGHLKSLNPDEKRAQKMRGKILGMAHEMGWKFGGLNNWCLQRSYLKKKLDAYDYNELPRLVTQFEQVYKSYLKGL